MMASRTSQARPFPQGLAYIRHIFQYPATVTLRNILESRLDGLFLENVADLHLFGPDGGFAHKSPLTPHFLCSLRSLCAALDGENAETYNSPHVSPIKYPIQNNCGSTAKTSLSPLSSLSEFRLGCSGWNLLVPLSASLTGWRQHYEQRTPMRCDDLQGLWKYAFHQPFCPRSFTCEGDALDGRTCQIPSGRRTSSSNHRCKEEA